MASLFRSNATSTGSSSSEIDTNQDKVVQTPAEDSISDLSFSPQAEYLTVASWDKKVRIYEVLPSGDTQGRALYEHQAPVLSAQWFPDGTKVASGGCDNAVRVYDVASGQAAQIGAHDQPVRSVRVVNVQGNPIVASASWDKTLKYWDVRQQNPVATVQLPERAYSMDTSRDLLVVATAQRNICVFNLSNPQTIFKTVQSPLKWQTRVVACYPQGNAYAIGSIEGRCAIQYVDPDEQAKSGFSFRCHRENKTPTETHIYPVEAISVHPIYGTFSTGGSDGTIHFWDKDSRFRLKYTRSLGGTVSATAYNRNGSIFAYAVTYDWSKGFQYNTPQYPIQLRLHPTTDAETKPRDKK